jgi:rhodanese-related sulfurtransferase
MINRLRAAGRILLEAVLVAAVGAAFAFAANQVSPRGLVLARNYFPTGTNEAVRMPTIPVVPDNVASTNPAPAVAAPSPVSPTNTQEVPWIDGPQAMQLFHDSHLKPGAVIFIDARDEGRYQEGHVPGAYEFDPYHPEKYFPEVLPVCRTAEQIVIYCNGGDCDDSKTAALLLKEVGIPDQKIFIYGGGIAEWTSTHQPVETGARNSGTLKIAIQ